MGFVENFKGMFVSVDDEYDDMVDYQHQQPQESRPVQQQVVQKPAPNQYYEEEIMAPRQTSNKIMSIPGNNSSQVSQMVVKRPTKYEQAPEIGAEIKARKTVFVNLENTPLDVSRRLLDFLSGVTFAMDGKVDKLANLTYIFAPHDAELTNDEFANARMDELETPGIYYS